MYNLEVLVLKDLTILSYNPFQNVVCSWAPFIYLNILGPKW